MDESLYARIEHELADLRAAFPRISACRAALEDWKDENGEPRYSARLDIRLPQHQSLVGGGSQASAYAAVRAAFDEASRHLKSLTERMD